MSGSRLIFAFKDGLNFAFNEEDIPQGGIIDFDMKFEDINIEYENPLMGTVQEQEKEGLPSLLKFSTRSLSSSKGKEIVEEQDPMEGPSHRLPSMVVTTAGHLIAANEQKIPFPSLRRTQRRNADRKKQRALAKARKEKEKLLAIPEEYMYNINMRESSDSLPMTEEEVQSVQHPEPSPVWYHSDSSSVCPTCHSATLEQEHPAGIFVECPRCNVLHLGQYCDYSNFSSANQLMRYDDLPIDNAVTTQYYPWDPSYAPIQAEAYNPVERISPLIWQPIIDNQINEEVHYPAYPNNVELAKIHNVKYNVFEHFEMVNGEYVNILEGLELYTEVFSPMEQREVLDCVSDLQIRGRSGLLFGKTYSEPKKWMRGKGRITIQCGCCYNYKIDQQGNLPGILQHEQVEPMPPTIKWMVTRLVQWNIIPSSCIPNSCIINIYEEGDCIPPHIDHHDFLRPFCTVSFISESSILFGTDIDIIGPGEFRGSVEVSLPRGSVLILKGNGADIAKHCIPGVQHRRVSITFRRMDDD
ncbi:uncharacterized protein LOC110036054, partial [Phalaenopsis equestris]|uniref:uncharacterized protein LOC110036054 n=1 Tax=Phalaenopsis equestris TaxID=78828 RepID=UPI0009E57F19